MSGGQALGDVPGLTTSLTLLCVIGVLLNIIVIIVLSTKIKSYSSVDLFVMNLCVSDIILAGVALPVRLNNASHEGESFKGGDSVCKMIMFIPLMTISSSISTMVAIAIDRFREIVKNQKMMPKVGVCVISGIWIWSISVSSPQLYEYSVYQKYEDDYNVTSCGSHDIVAHFETAYACVIIVLSYAVPLVIITISYAHIMIFVWKAGKSQFRVGNQVLKKRVKIVKLLMAVTIVFALLWSPYFIMFGMEEVLGLDDTIHTGSGPNVTKNVMVVLSTMSNPIIHFISDSKFRKDFVDLFTMKQCVRKPPNRVHPKTTVSLVSNSGQSGSKQLR